MKPVPYTTSQRQTTAQRQRGVTLIELMVGITIGLLTIAVAMGALMASRDISGTVSDASQIQQQASYALRAIGWQLRQAGTPSLNLAALKAHTASVATTDPVAFEKPTKTIGISGTDPDPKAAPSTQATLTISYNRDPIYGSDTSQQRDCLGGPDDNPTVVNSQVEPTTIKSQFKVDTDNHELECEGSPNTTKAGTSTTTPSTQPIIGNVAKFQVRYLVQTDSNTSAPKIKYLSAKQASADWSQVTAVEVCLVVYGNEAIDLPQPSYYFDCPDVNTGDRLKVDMTDSKLPIEQRNRMHMTFSNVYQIRSQARDS